MATREQGKPPGPRTRRPREDIRDELLEAALVEFGEKGFDGASTRRIAQRANAHQPQINYHFASKEALWTAAVDHLFGLLGQAMAGISLAGGDLTVVNIETADAHDLADGFAEVVRRLVRFAAAHPELNRIIVHEATTAGDRLTWITETHVAPLYQLLRAVWRRLLAAGLAAPIDESMVHYVLVGAASLPYVNAPEARLLTGVEPTDPAWVETHADGLVATLLPGHLPGRGRDPKRRAGSPRKRSTTRSGPRSSPRFTPPPARRTEPR